MRILYLFTFLFIFLISIALQSYPQDNMVTISGSFFSLGLKNNRSASSTSPNRITVPEFSIEYKTDITSSLSASFTYENYYLLNSSLLLSLDYNWRNMSFTVGGAGGFLNQFTLNLVPGLIVGIDYNPWKVLNIGFQGRTGFFLKPLLSLEESNYTFDQNNFKSYAYLDIGYAIFGLMYSKDMFYHTISSTEYIKNYIKKYEAHILTNAKNSAINSATALGGEIHNLKTESFNHKILDFYIEETLLLSIKNFELKIGTKMTFLMFMLKGLNSSSPPSMPRFEINTSAGYRFKVKSK